MNLNPLKKEDGNADNNNAALVKALEDANSVGTATPGMQPPTQPAVTNTVPVEESPAADLATSAPLDDTPAPDPVSAPTDDVTTPEDTTDTTAGITFDGNDLPSGLSSDAEAHVDNSATGDAGELDTVKNSALEQLRPLIEKLDLEPADKFDKYLMMLRASDDPELIKPAFDAAQGIDGEKERAQALLDIINEINYITANQQ